MVVVKRVGKGLEIVKRLGNGFEGNETRRSTYDPCSGCDKGSANTEYITSNAPQGTPQDSPGRSALQKGSYFRHGQTDK